MCKAYNSYFKDKLPVPAQSLKEALRLMIPYLKRKLIPFFYLGSRDCEVLIKICVSPYSLRSRTIFYICNDFSKYQYDYIYKYIL